MSEAESKSTLEEELKQMLVKELNLEDVDPAELGDEDPLFGDGLGLDSLDAVELVVLMQKHYKVEIKDMEEGRAAFASIKSLADYIREHRPAE
ncbi:MAG: phosphopantetheine-binding protein [Candidatus Sumerlaeia bacterium]